MLSLEQIRDAAYVALRLLLGESYSANWCIVATFQDSIIVSRGPLKLERYTLTVAADRSVTLSPAQAVELVYQSLAESNGARVLGAFPLAEGKEGAGKEWACVVIEEGVSANRRMYTAGALAGAVSLFENAQCYFTHAASSKPEPDPRDLAGFLRSAKLGLLEAPKKTAILANFRSTSKRATELLQEAFEAGNTKLFGLSIHASGTGAIVRRADGPVYRVDSIDAVESVDLVSKPAAGGRFLSLVAGLPARPVTEQELDMLDKKIAKLREARPDLAAKLKAEPTEAEVDALLLEAVLPKVEPAPAAAVVPPVVAPAAASVAQDPELKALLQEAKVDKLMKGRTLSEPMQEPTRKTVLALIEAGAPDATVKTFIDEQVAANAKLVEVTGAGTGVGVVRTAAVQKDEVDKIQSAWHGFFEGKDVDGVPRYTSLREGYIQTTGDKHVTGLVKESKDLGRFAQLFEGLQSGSFANVLASSLNRQLVANYNAQGLAYADDGKGWLYRTVPANDFRNRERVRFGGYGNLAGVAEGNPYPVMTSPTDEKATYAVTKRGGVETITYEMVRNDDVGAVQEIPRRMAFAARRTFYEFVHNFYALNPTIYDAVALFHATHGGNLGAAALAAASFSAARLVMKKQTEKDSAKRVGLVLRHLMVPEDLAETAYNLFVRDTNLDEKFVQTSGVAPTVHVITHLTDTNDWFACAGIDQSPQIEIGFLDGREDPEIFVADIPNGGSLFAADKIDYKIRHIYGGNVLDFRPFFGAFGI